ncbi:DUF4190 domain-containing protein [Arthrobacter sp. SRS-W-1-2016]|uniref:DUF4190 domain-containing protein n=1 Tax=Arthrobacter sp. SRS-W-1-2016 TaxID=1930254 RepID=UPI0011160E33|nr:DUF4190 domain-containing protein [Arthrobacter sp. SRS-W-1-2016]
MSEESGLLTAAQEAPGSLPKGRPRWVRALVGASIVVVSWQIVFYLIYPLIQAFGFQAASVISYTLLALRFLLVLGGFFLAAKKKILVLPAIVLVVLGLALTSLAAVPGVPFSYLHGYASIGLAGPVAIYACMALFYFTSWLVLRGRPVRSYVAIVPVIGVAIGMALLGNMSSGITWTLPAYSGAVLALTCIGCAWLAMALDPRRNEIPVEREPLRQTYEVVHPTVTTPGQTNGMAIASLIVVFFNSVIGLILGHIALSQIKKNGQAGHGLALAAVIIGWITTGIAVVAVAAYFIILGTSAARYR